MPFLVPQAFYRRLQVTGHQVCIHLGDSDRTVAEQFRYGLDVHAGHDHVAGKGVTQAVDGQVFHARFLDDLLEGLGHEVGQEREGFLAGLLHPPEHIGENAVERHQPVLPGFGLAEGDSAALHVHVVPGHVESLVASRARVEVEENQVLESSFGDRIQQPSYLLLTEILGVIRSFDFQELDGAKRVLFQVAPPDRALEGGLQVLELHVHRRGLDTRQPVNLVGLQLPGLYPAEGKVPQELSELPEHPFVHGDRVIRLGRLRVVQVFLNELRKKDPFPIEDLETKGAVGDLYLDLLQDKLGLFPV